MTVAHVIVVSNQLEANELGTIDGHLQCQLVEATSYSFKYSDFVCVMNHVDRASLLKLKEDQRARIEYRQKPLWPILEQDDPYRIFLNQHLGIPNTEILGAVSRRGVMNDDSWMEIIVRGGNASDDR